MGFVKTYQEIMANVKTTAEFYDAEILSVFWETRAETVARLLPPPLNPASYPLAIAFVANYPETNFNVRYRESALFLRAEYKGEEGSYCLAMPVTNDMAMAGGRESFGLPKKMADIHVEKSEKNFSGWTERHGIRFMEIRAQMTGSFNDEELFSKGMFDIKPSEPTDAISFSYQFFPPPNAAPAEYNPWLIKQKTVFRPKEIQIGEAEIVLKHSDYDSWAEVEIVKPLGAIYTKGENTMLPGEAVEKIDPIKFAPYAFLRTDII